MSLLLIKYLTFTIQLDCRSSTRLRTRTWYSL